MSQGWLSIQPDTLIGRDFFVYEWTQISSHIEALIGLHADFLCHPCSFFSNAAKTGFVFSAASVTWAIWNFSSPWYERCSLVLQTSEETKMRQIVWVTVLWAFWLQVEKPNALRLLHMSSHRVAASLSLTYCLHLFDLFYLVYEAQSRVLKSFWSQALWIMEIKKEWKVNCISCFENGKWIHKGSLVDLDH